MIVAVDRRHAEENHKSYLLPNGTKVTLDTYIGTNLVVRSGARAAEPEPLIGAPYPMAYMVSQPAGTEIAPHFHQNDQFQIFVAGEGRIGRHVLAPVTAHYAAAFSAYGPIIAAGSPIRYLTLRNGYDPGAQWLPGAKEKLFSAPNRDPRVETCDPFDFAAATTGTSQALIAREGSGLGAWAHVVAPGQSVTGEDPASGAGQFWFTLSGQVVRDGREHGPGTCVFVSRDEAPQRIVAGGSRLEVIVVQFPRR